MFTSTERDVYKIQLAGLETFTKKLQDLAETASTNIVLLISADESEIPESINAVCRKV